MLNHIITKSIREHFARQWWDRNAGALSLQNITEVLEVRVASAHNAMVELEGGNVGSAHDLVVGVHVAANAMRTRVFYLRRGISRC